VGLLETKKTEVINDNWRRIGKSLTLNLSECRATKALISGRRESLAKKEGRSQHKSLSVDQSAAARRCIT